MKFAFVANIAGVSPETYSTVYETAGNYNLVAGVDGMSAAKEYIRKLAEDGFELINLCGDFNDEVTEEIRDMVGERVEVRNVQYTVDDLIKLDFLESFKNYGVMIHDENVEKFHEVVLRSDACDMRVIFVPDMRQAKRAAARMLEKRVGFMDLCSWFDTLRLEVLIDATDNSIPIGTCGEMDILKVK